MFYNNGFASDRYSCYRLHWTKYYWVKYTNSLGIIVVTLLTMYEGSLVINVYINLFLEESVSLMSIKIQHVRKECWKLQMCFDIYEYFPHYITSFPRDELMVFSFTREWAIESSDVSWTQNIYVRVTYVKINYNYMSEHHNVWNIWQCQERNWSDSAGTVPSLIFINAKLT